MTRLLLLAVVLAVAGCAGPQTQTQAQTEAAAQARPSTAAAPQQPASTPPPPRLRPPARFEDGPPLSPIAQVELGEPGVRTVTSTSVPADLWERIRRGFAMPDLDSELVRDREDWYASRPDYIQRMTERSRKYLFHIVDELERRGMPTELALLPFIESAFNPQAMSSARAAGMWQFIPSTGKSFDLKQNVFRDDRRDVLASTRAALDYLQRLYGMFGDWHLALAAYNWGEGSVSRARSKNQRAGLPTGYTDLNMPMETRFYVPKLQAVKNIVARPADFHTSLPLIENHPYFQTVTLARDMDVAQAARLADISLDDFKALNPSANRPVLLAAGTPHILLPWDNAALFQSNLEAFGGARLASWTAWIAPSTMKVADAARRVGLSEAEFRSINNIPPHMLVRAGSTLLVPRQTHHTEDVALHVADNAQLSLSPEVTLRRHTVKARKGETVAQLAARYKQSAAQVAEWNQTSPGASFKPGQSVVLMLPEHGGAAARKKGHGAGGKALAQRSKGPRGTKIASAR